MSDATECFEPLDGGRDLTLNEVARRLGKVPEIQTSGKIAVAPLLSLLRNDALPAFALYPSLLIPRLKVPTAYWHSIDSANFKQIIFQPGKKFRRGTYLVPVDSLFDSYLDQVFVAIGPQASPDARDQALRSDLRAVVHCFGETREVTVPEVAWTKLLTARDWVESQDAGSKGRGRPEKAWSDLFPYLINEMLGPDAKLNEKSKNMAERVLQAAKANGAQNLPAENSLKDRINVIYRELNALRKK